MIEHAVALRPAVVLVAVALVVGLRPDDPGSTTRSTSALTAGPRAGVDATSEAEARQLRRATRRLAEELDAAARCDAREPRHRFAACVGPALRHAGMGGRTTAMLLRGVIGGVPDGRCRARLIGLQAANGAAAENAQWLLPLLYGAGPGRRRREIATQLELSARMLQRASRPADAGACSLSSDGPAI